MRTQFCHCGCRFTAQPFQLRQHSRGNDFFDSAGNRGTDRWEFRQVLLATYHFVETVRQIADARGGTVIGLHLVRIFLLRRQ